MTRFLDVFVPSRLLPPHLALVMIRQINRDRAQELAREGGVAGFVDPDLAEDALRDLGVELREALGPPTGVWDGVWVERVPSGFAYWFLQVR